jgi:hypothetical protein
MHPSPRYVGVIILLAFGLALASCSSASVNAKPSTSPVPQGANPVTWVGALCGGLGDVVAGVEVMKTEPPTPQGRKDGLLKVADTTQQAFTNTANKLIQLGPPAITNGNQAQNDATSFFTTTAAAVGDQRAKIAALDTNNPNFAQEADQLSTIGGNATATQLQKLTTNSELMPAFGRAPECQRLLATPAPAH